MGQEALDTGSYRDYISLGLLADHDSEAYQYAEEIRAKLNTGRPVSNIEMGQLTAAVYADTLGVGEKRNAEVPDDYVRDGVLEEDDTVFQQALMEEMGLETEAIYNTETGLSNGSNGDIIEHKTGVHIGNSAGTKLLDAFAQLTNEEVAALTNVWNDITPTQQTIPELIFLVRLS